MKVAFVVGNFPVVSQTFILNQIAGLRDLGHEVDILSCGPGDGVAPHPIVEKYGLLEKTVYIIDPAETWRHRFLHGDGVFWRFFLKDPALALRMINVFRYGRQALSLWILYLAHHLEGRGPYDVIHCQFGPYGLLMLPLVETGAVKGKLIVQFRGYDISQYVRENGERVYDRLFRKADHFLANCEYFRKRLLTLGCDPERADVLYSGIDCDKFRFKERTRPQGTVRIGMVGRLVEKKGIEYVIRALAILKKKDLEPELHLVGDGPLEKSLRDLGHSLNVEHQVYFHGPRTQAELVLILDECHLFTAPSVTAASGDQDAPVNVLKEAMAMGLPVVSTRHGGIPELVEDGVSGYLVPERDAEALAEKLEILLRSPESWAAMGRAGRRRVEDIFDMTKLNKRLEGIYQRVLKTK